MVQLKFNLILMCSKLVCIYTIHACNSVILSGIWNLLELLEYTHAHYYSHLRTFADAQDTTYIRIIKHLTSTHFYFCHVTTNLHNEHMHAHTPHDVTKQPVDYSPTVILIASQYCFLCFFLLHILSHTFCGLCMTSV